MRYILLLIGLLAFNTNSFSQCGAGESKVYMEIDASVGYFADEISWKLFDADTEALIASESEGFVQQGAIYTNDFCLTDGVNYRFEAYDSYGDGWGDVTYTFRYGDGSPIKIGMPDNGENSYTGVELEETTYFKGGDLPGNECATPYELKNKKTVPVNTSYYEKDPLLPSGKQAFYQFTPTITDSYRISLANLDPLELGSIKLYDGCPDTSPNLLGSQETGGTRTELEVIAALTQGESYYVVVSNDGINGAVTSIEGNLKVEYNNPTSPANTTCSSAFELILDGSAVDSRISGINNQTPVFTMQNPDTAGSVFESYADQLFYEFNLASQTDVLVEIDGYSQSKSVFIELIRKSNCAASADFVYKRASLAEMEKGFGFENLPTGAYSLVIYPPNYLPSGDQFSVSLKSQSSLPISSNGDCSTAKSIELLNEFYELDGFTSIPYFNTSDTWVKAKVPESGNLVIEMAGELYKRGIGDQAIEGRFAVYTGACSALTEFYTGNSTFSHQADTLQGLPAGEEVYIKMWDKDRDNSGYSAIRLMEPDPVPTSDNEISSTPNSLLIDFIGPYTDYEYLYNVQVSKDNFSTYLSGYNPATVTSSVAQLSVGNLEPATTYYIRYWGSKSKLDNSDTIVVQVETAPTIVKTVASGDWSDPNIWSGGQVPAIDSAAHIYHQVSINEGESVEVKEIAIKAGEEVSSYVGLWINNASVTVEKDLKASIVSAEITDSVGVFMTADVGKSTSLWVGRDINFELNDQPVTSQLQFSAFNDGGSLDVNVGNDFIFQNLAGSLAQGGSYNNNIDLNDVDLSVANIFNLHSNSYDNAQDFKSLFHDSRINANTFVLDIPEKSYAADKVSFTGSTNLTLTGDFRRSNIGGAISFEDQSVLHFAGTNNQSIAGYDGGPQQDHIFYNDIVVDISNTPSKSSAGAFLTIRKSGVETESMIRINGELQLLNGFIEGRDGMVRFENTSSVTGTSPDSYVMIPVTKIGDTEFTFPVGHESGLRQIEMLNSINFTPTTHVEVTAKNNFCGYDDGLLTSSGLARDRTNEFWEVNIEVFGAGASTYFKPIVTDLLAEGITDISSLELVDFYDGTTLGNDAGTRTANSFQSNSVYAFSSGVSALLGLASSNGAENPFYYRKNILSLSQYAAAAGESITLNYSGPFASVADKVYFGGKLATTTSNTDNTLTVTVPDGARSGTIDLLYESDKIHYAREDFTVKYDSTITLDSGNYSIITTLESISGDVQLGKTKMELGQIDNDDTFDAMIVTAGYQQISLVNNLSGATVAQEFEIMKGYSGDALIPSNFVLGLSNQSGSYQYDAYFGVSAANKKSLYAANDGNGNYSSLFMTSNEVNPVVDDVFFLEYDYDGTTDPAISAFDSPSTSLESEANSSGDCSTNGLGNFAFTEPQDRRLNQVLKGNYIDNDTVDIVYLIEEESTLGIFSLYNPTDLYVSGTARPSDQLFEIVNISLLGDGINQVVASNQSTNEIEVYSFNNTTETIDATTISLSFTPGKMVAEDMNGDGFQDLLVSDQNTAAIYLLLNNGSGVLAENVSYQYPGGIVADFNILDMNNDGIKDILILQEGGKLSAVYYKKYVTLETPAPVASNATSNSFDLDWPSINGAENYEVYIGTDSTVNSTGQWDSTFTVPTNSLQYTVPEYSEEYFYFVKALNSEYQLESNFNEQQTITLPVSSYLEQDSLALVALYDSTAGDEWNTKQNWLVDKVNTWSGLAMSADSLKAIDLSSNNLSGKVPEEMKNLNFVHSIDFSNNQLTDLAALVGLTNQLDTLNLSKNKLSFEQLQGFETIVNYNYGEQSYEYVLLDEYFVELEDTVVLHIDAPASNNTFQWYKDSVMISGATSSNLVLSNVDQSDQGSYYVEIMNSDFAGLALKSNVAEVRVLSLQRDMEALRQFYIETNGENWSSIKWDTTSDDLSKWASGTTGIVVENGRVVEINLPENNLSGRVSQILTEISRLKSIDLSGNAIEDVEDLSVLPELDSLNMSQNALGYDDIERNITIPNFNFSEQAYFGSTEDQNISQGDSFTLEYNVAGENNTYQWILNNEVIEGADSSSITIDSITFQDMGNYTLKVKNTVVNAVKPDFKLQSKSVEVFATANFSGMVAVSAQNTIEAGRVYLFKYREDQAYDSVRLESGALYAEIEEGAFDLGNVQLGDYLLYVDNDEGEYPDLVNTYYPNAIDWEAADIIEFRSNEEGLDVTMAGIPQKLDGTSRLSGYLEEIVDIKERKRRRRVSAAGVSARRLSGSSREVNFKAKQADNELVAYVETDDNGEFSIPNLPAGRYVLKCNVPGVPMDETSDIIFELTGEDQEALEVAAVWDEGSISVNKVRYTANKSALEQNVSVYPNPSTGVFTVQGGDNVTNIKVLSAAGKVLKEMSGFDDISREIEIDMSDYPNGMYFMQLVWKDGLRTTNKLVKE